MLAPARRTVGAPDGARQHAIGELSDAGPDPQGRWRRPEVRELEGTLALEPGVDETSGGVNQDREPADAAATLDASDEVIWNVHALERRPERKLARTQDKVDALGELLDVLGGPDRAPQLAAQTQVDAGGLKLELEIGERLDDDATVAQPLTKVAIGQDHGAPPPRPPLAATPRAPSRC